MTYNAKDELMDDVAAATVSAQVITWTTNEPTVSYAYTVADGSAPTSTELGIIVATQNAQIDALIADVLALRTAVNA
jgi:hypothetical protein